MILQLKDRGTLVEKLQEKLGIDSNGIFDQDTVTAVKEFQITHNLTADGIAGDKTLQTLGLDFSSYKKNGTNLDVSWELPAQGVGFVAYNREARGDQFGTKETILKAQEIAKEWYKLHPEALIQYGDISYLYGGDTPDHATHEKGLDIDLRPFRKDAKLLGVTYQDSNYSQSLTREFLKMIKGKVRGVYFNDPILIKEKLCSHSAGHQNHLHIMMQS